MKKKRTSVEETKWSTDPKERISSEDYLVYVSGGSQWGKWVEEVVAARWNRKTSAWEYTSERTYVSEGTEQVHAWLRIPPMPASLKQDMGAAKRRYREERKAALDYLGVEK